MRLHVGCHVARDPGRFIVLNSDTGAPSRVWPHRSASNAEIFDVATGGCTRPAARLHRVYAEVDAGHFAKLAQVPTRVGAKTAILVPELHRLYVAVLPREGKTGGGNHLVRRQGGAGIYAKIAVRRTATQNGFQIYSA